MSYSPTQLSIRRWKKLGFNTELVQRWDSFAKCRRDLLGFIDILCLCDGITVGVQATSWGHVSDRQKKIYAHPKFTWAKRAGWRVIVEGWKKNQGGHWINRSVEL